MNSDFVSLFNDERDASRAPSQSGASNCGEASVKASLLALRIPESPSGGVTVRSRDYSTTSLVTYLRSRARAGCTGADLVSGACSLSGGQAEAKFFACGPAPPAGLTKWLAEWISRGAAPIVTINTQLDGADYWHHQAVLGVRPASGEIQLANPFERVSDAALARLLGSESVLLITPSDVLSRCPVEPDELQQLRAAPRWAQLDVAAQVERLVETRGRAEREQVAIPASYVPGVTLVAHAGSECARQLQQAQSPWSDRPHEPVGL